MRISLVLILLSLLICDAAFSETKKSIDLFSDLFNGRSEQLDFQVETNDGANASFTLPKGRIFITEVVCNLILDRTDLPTIRMIAEASAESGLSSHAWFAPVINGPSTGKASATFQLNTPAYLNNKKSSYTIRLETTGSGSECNFSYLKYK